MKKDGGTSIQILLWILGAVGAVSAYAHMTFITYREVAPRLDRIEDKIDAIVEKIKPKGE